MHATLDKQRRNEKSLALLGESQSSIECYIACRLIPLDKDGDGVRPIGIGEVLRRIIGKSIISVLRPDLLESAGSIQLCAGHQAGCESALKYLKKRQQMPSYL